MSLKPQHRAKQSSAAYTGVAALAQGVKIAPEALRAAHAGREAVPHAPEREQPGRGVDAGGAALTVSHAGAAGCVFRSVFVVAVDGHWRSFHSLRPQQSLYFMGRPLGLSLPQGAGVVAAGLLDLTDGLFLLRLAAYVGGLVPGDALALHGLLARDAHYEEPAHRLLAYAAYHGFEHLEALVLVGVDGLRRAVAAQVYAAAQLGHGVEVVHPVLVDHAQHHDALDLAHERRAVGRRAEGGLFLLIEGEGALEDHFAELIRGERGEAVLREAYVARREEKPPEGGEYLVHGAQVGRMLLGEAVGDRALDELLYHLADGRLEVLAVEDLPALGVDDVALDVHDVVVLEHVLTGLEVAALDGLLRLLNGVGEHLLVERGVLVYLERVHHAHYALGAEEAHDVVRHGEVEAALARVALAAGAAAQLVVYTARLVPLRAEDEEAARGLDALGPRPR